MGLTVFTRDGRVKDRSSGQAPQGVVFRVIKTSVETLNPTNNVRWDLKEHDPYNWFDLGNRHFRPRVAGYYALKVNIHFTSGGDQAVHEFSIRKNAAEITRSRVFASAPVANGGVSATATALVYLNGSTDQVDVAIENVQRSVHGDANARWTVFEGELLGTAKEIPTSTRNAFEVRRNAALSLSAGAGAKQIVLDQLWTNSAGVSISNGDVVIPQAGLWMLGGSIGLLPGVVGAFSASLTQNGSTANSAEIHSAVTGNGLDIVMGAVPVPCGAGDVFRLSAGTANGSNSVYTGTRTRVTGYRISD